MADDDVDGIDTLHTELTKLQAQLASREAMYSDPELADLREANLAAAQKLRERIGQLESQISGDTIARDKINTQINVPSGNYLENITVEPGGTIVIAESGAQVFAKEQPIAMNPAMRETAHGKYLAYLISHHRYLQLQGIRSGGKLVNIELDRIYITLRATRERTLSAEDGWLQHEGQFAPGEMGRFRLGMPRQGTETVNVSINEALLTHRRLVVLGDPGSGKTTLLRYLTLLYARDQAERQTLIQDKLGLPESGYLPISLALRQIGAFLRDRQPNSDGTEGHALLLDFLQQTLKHERIEVPIDFFDKWLIQGQAVILLDGMDEVADPTLRNRVSRLIEAFTRAYPQCRYVITSRVKGYTDAARLGEDYTTTTVRDFTTADIRAFLAQWHRLVGVGQLGPGDTAEHWAIDQTAQLLASIEAKERVRELAINPLMLTVIAMIHRDRVKLPDRRAELYAEAVDVLLGKWDEAKGTADSVMVGDILLDVGAKRLALQSVALYMHEKGIKEIETEPLRQCLARAMSVDSSDPRDEEQILKPFLAIIEERTGLLVARAEGLYAFSHLTFQEYLAALAIAAKDAWLKYMLPLTGQEWWREVVLLLAGHLSTGGKEKTTRLISEIAARTEEPSRYHNLILAAECYSDAGASRVEGNIGDSIRQRLQMELETPTAKGRFAIVTNLMTRGMTTRQIVQRRVAAAEALSRIGGQRYWSMPYGEPEWVTIPEGEFWMGSEDGHPEEQPIHQVFLRAYQIARVPITNAQYAIFVQEAKHEAPYKWGADTFPKGKDSYPVTDVTWYDALDYCKWLSEVTGKQITLPSEAEWEKAARGDQDRRKWPWGDQFESNRCISYELGLESTTPVGLFKSGISPYGCLDMAGNVWEWTRSVYGQATLDTNGNVEKRPAKPYYPYPYIADNNHENLDADKSWTRVLRGGVFYYSQDLARCACRFNSNPENWLNFGFGFRVVVLSPSDL